VLVFISALVTELIIEDDINWGTVIAVPIVAVVVSVRDRPREVKAHLARASVPARDRHF